MQAIINSKLILPHTVLSGQTLLFGTHIYDILPAGSPYRRERKALTPRGPIFPQASSICTSMAAAGPIQWTEPAPPWKSSAGDFQNAALRHFYRRQ